VKGKGVAISEALQLNLKDHYLYHMLLGKLHENIDNTEAHNYYLSALILSKSEAEQAVIEQHIHQLTK
jgi:predicted RNA polymerase sigma factor